MKPITKKSKNQFNIRSTFAFSQAANAIADALGWKNVSLWHPHASAQYDSRAVETPASDTVKRFHSLPKIIVALVLVYGLVLGIAWLFFPFLLFDRLKKQRKLLEEIKNNTQTMAYCAQKADKRAQEAVSLAEQQCR